MAKISITEALVKLKTLSKRIESAIVTIRPIALVTGKNFPTGFKSMEEFETAAKTAIQSAQDLIKYRQTVKSAIVAANAVTIAIIGGKSLTVAQAIERKNSIGYEKELLKTLSQNYSATLKQQMQKEAEAEKRLDEQLAAILGRDVKSRDATEAEAQTKLFWDNNKPKLIDPLNLKNLIETLEKDITEFEGEVDFRLSEANAKTEIEVPE